MARDPAMTAIAALAEKVFDGVNGFANAGRTNLYQCEAWPHHVLITVDREPGVTPFTIECPQCRAEGRRAEKGIYRHPAMQSSCYRTSASLRPTHEWYRPDTLAEVQEAERQHVRQGGLVLREIGGQA